MSVDLNNKGTFFHKFLELKKDLEQFRKDLEELKKDISIKYEDKDSEKENKSNIIFCDVTLASVDEQENADIGLGLSFNFSKFDDNFHLKNQFPCNLCPKSHPLKSHLKLHMRTHTGDKPYACSECDKLFPQQSIFNSHTKISFECQENKSSIKSFQEGELIFPKHNQNFIYQVF